MPSKSMVMAVSLSRVVFNTGGPLLGRVLLGGTSAGPAGSLVLFLEDLSAKFLASVSHLVEMSFSAFELCSGVSCDNPRLLWTQPGRLVLR